MSCRIFIINRRTRNLYRHMVPDHPVNPSSVHFPESTSTSTSISISVYIYIYASVFASISISISTSTYTYIYIYICLYLYVYICIPASPAPLARFPQCPKTPNPTQREGLSLAPMHQSPRAVDVRKRRSNLHRSGRVRRKAGEYMGGLSKLRSLFGSPYCRGYRYKCRCGYRFRIWEVVKIMVP